MGGDASGDWEAQMAAERVARATGKPGWEDGEVVSRISDEAVMVRMKSGLLYVITPGHMARNTTHWANMAPGRKVKRRLSDDCISSPGKFGEE